VTLNLDGMFFELNKYIIQLMIKKYIKINVKIKEVKNLN